MLHFLSFHILHLTFRLNCPFIPTDSKPCWKNGNYEQLSSLLKSINWKSSINNPVIDVNYEALLSAYNSGVSKFVPSYSNSPVSIANKQSPKWFNKTLKKLTHLKYKLFICTRIHPVNSDINDQYRTVCLQLKKSLRQARLKYELNIISLSKHNPKLIYSYVKSQRKLPSQIRSLIDPQGNTITDMPKIVNMLNDHLAFGKPKPR
ncbi:RNA-directed DNA polymerase from mobile element jockey-like [Brachionus plicatilis]|uniref:RNA-directed DNA polymerase from mobile element jockey-like n=1 Tax=Brachionus plicatilis TaxID=10195 RepID=A0A3M7QQD6_BRAPC|nr:RNA-directed DNA polymerase from mobile element jockey-like [Brachionus plicatilis]